jgi:glycosyltransferase involved in cell wall biosynthesis
VNSPRLDGSEPRPAQLALSILCENPQRRTGLSTLFPAFVSEALKLFPKVTWLVFAGPNQPWPLSDSRVQVVRRFAANDSLFARLWADHFRVASEARRRGAAALLTVGFCPILRAGLPTAMHVFTVHHRGAGVGLRSAYRRWATNHGIKNASLIITNSGWTASKLRVDPKRLLVSYEGLDADLFKPEGPGYKGLAAGSYLLWASNFYRYKRVELALGAYAQVPATLRTKYPLVLVGGDWNGQRARAEALVQRLGLGSYVHFLGWVDDESLPALYHGARAHVLSTAEETFGRTVLEAMACGCPCVLQDLPVLREVTNGSALFVDFTDQSAAGAALTRICTDDALARSLKERGLRRSRDFSFARLARERIEAILKMLHSPGRPTAAGSPFASLDK